MSRATRYPNQFFEPTPIALVEWALNLHRQSQPSIESRAATSAPTTVPATPSRWRFRSRPRALRLKGGPARRAA